MSLVIRNLSKSYPNGVKAVDDLSLEIGTGMFGLLGPNGAGKSTLMRIIASLQQPDTGTIHFEGIDVRKDQQALRKLLGYLPQEFGVYPGVSAWRLLDYFASLKGIRSKADRRRRVGEVLGVTNLLGDRKKKVSSYSGGMKRRFGIAQLLLNDPKLIIVDEPTAGLDPAERQHFLNLLRDIGSRSTVIFSTHIVDDIKALCNSLGILNQGQLLQTTSPEDALQQLEGKVWEAMIKPTELDAYKARFEFLSSSFKSNQTVGVRVFGKEQPDTSFYRVAPTLDDFYFRTLELSSYV